MASLEDAFGLPYLVDDSRLHVVGRCGHRPRIEHAAESNRLVGDLLA